MERKRGRIKSVFWQDKNMWLGYLEEDPDYMPQGKTENELIDNLKDIYAELNNGSISCARKVTEL